MDWVGMVAELAIPSLGRWLNIGRVLVHDGLAPLAIYRVPSCNLEFFRQAAHGELKHVCVNLLLILIIRLRHLWHLLRKLRHVWVLHSKVLHLRVKLMGLGQRHAWWELRNEITVVLRGLHHLLWLLWKVLLLLLGLKGVRSHEVLRLRRHHLLIVT